MYKLAQRLVAHLESSPLNFFFWLGTFLSIIIARVMIEGWLIRFKSGANFSFLYEFSHTFLFFLIAYLLFLWVIRMILKVEFSKAANILLWGYLLIITPPLFDFWISGGSGFWSFYKFDDFSGIIGRFFTFFGDRPDIGITYGVRIEVALALALLTLYAYLKSKSFLKAWLTALLSYLIFFILGTFPAWIEFVLSGPRKGLFAVTEIDIAERFLSPARIFSYEVPGIINALNFRMSLVYALFLCVIVFSGLFYYQRSKFVSFLKNFRPPQITYHLGLLGIGLGLGFIANRPSFFIGFFEIIACLLLASAVILAWLASVIINDLIDQKVDAVTNPTRPLIKNTFSPEEYSRLGWVLFGASLFFSALLHFQIFLLLLFYQGIAFLYSAWPLRLKRIPLVATFLSAIASLLIVFSGFVLLSPTQSLDGFSLAIGLLLIIGYALGIPLKDFKDIPGDRQDGIYTLPVILGEQWSKLFIASGVFLTFVLSVILLNEHRLFWWAVIFGALAFWVIMNMRPAEDQSKITYRNIFWWILGIVSGYGIVLIRIIFLA